MDLQILFNNPTKKKKHKMKMNPKKGKEKAMGKFKKKKNPRNVYRKAMGVVGADGKAKQVKGPSFKVGKINLPSFQELNDKRKSFEEAISSIKTNIKDPKEQKKRIDKYSKMRKQYADSLRRASDKVKSEESRLNKKGYIKDSTMTESEAKSKMREERQAVVKAEKEYQKQVNDTKKFLAKIDKDLEKKLGVKKKKAKKKKAKKVSKKKLSKKSSKKKASKKKVSKKKVSHKKKGHKKSKKITKKRNPIEILSNPSQIEILENPKKKGKKTKKKKAKKSSKKKSSKKKSSKKKSSKKKSKMSKEIKVVKKAKKAKKKSFKKKHISMKSKGSKSKVKSFKKKKHKLKSNPERGVSSMASKFEKITKHDGMEATGLVVGGALIRLYNHGLKSKVVNLPVIKNIYSMIPASMSPAFDGVVDVLLALGVGHLGSMIAQKAGKGEDKVEALSKGLIGAAVVSFAMKATQSTFTAITGNQMNGIIAVPSMNGIIAVPAMDGIIGVREMGDIGAASDFGRMDISSSDFGAPYTVGLNGGYLQKADYDSGSVIPTAARNPDALGSYENVEYSDEESDADF